MIHAAFFISPPPQNAFDALKADKDKQTALRRDLENLWLKNKKATDRTTTIESEYLEIIARRE